MKFLLTLLAVWRQFKTLQAALSDIKYLKQLMKGKPNGRK